MKVIIVGCGRVGQPLAEKRNIGGNEVTVIDTSTDKVNETTEQFDVMSLGLTSIAHRASARLLRDLQRLHSVRAW